VFYFMCRMVMCKRHHGLRRCATVDSPTVPKGIGRDGKTILTDEYRLPALTSLSFVYRRTDNYTAFSTPKVFFLNHAVTRLTLRYSRSVYSLLPLHNKKTNKHFNKCCVISFVSVTRTSQLHTFDRTIAESRH